MIAIPISISLSVVSVLPGASVSDLFLAGIIPGILAKFTNKVVLLFVINLFLLAVGMEMDTTPAILILTPILTPILMPIVTAAGVSPVHFGIIMVVNLAIGFVTPPIGVNLFVAPSLVEIPIMNIAKQAMPMIIYFLIALLVITFVPALSLALL